MGMNSRQPPGAESGPWTIASEKTGTSVTQSEGARFCQSLNELESRFFLNTPRQEVGPDDSLILVSDYEWLIGESSLDLLSTELWLVLATMFVVICYIAIEK